MTEQEALEQIDGYARNCMLLMRSTIVELLNHTILKAESLNLDAVPLSILRGLADDINQMPMIGDKPGRQPLPRREVQS